MTLPLFSPVTGDRPPVSGIDAAIDGVVGPIATALSDLVFFALPVGGTKIPVLVLWLLAAAVFLTVRLGFQPVRGIRHSLDLARGRFTRLSDPGQVTSFQALATELSGTVGLGNIAGVAVAIGVGGPGASLWIIVAGLLGMSVKMAEATLGVLYRRPTDDGTVTGGPMYYLVDGLRGLGRPRLGRVLGTAYAAFALIGTLGAGNLFQANQAAAQLTAATGGDAGPLAGRGWLVGVVLAAMTAAVILGGLRSIAKWTSRITPIMGIAYVLSALTILAVNIRHLPDAVAAILQGAFTGAGVAGGAFGVAIIGIQRALFSNAAGVGTAAMAHAAVKTRRPASEGFVAMWEPFIDSVVICTMTALAIIVTGQHEVASADGIGLTSAAFATVAGWFPMVLTACVLLFALSTVLSYAYYFETAATYLFGEGRVTQLAFRILWILGVVVGSAVSLQSVIDLSDSAFFLMTLPNLLGIYLLSGVLRREILGHKFGVDEGLIRPVPEHEQVGLTADAPVALHPDAPRNGHIPVPVDVTADTSGTAGA